MIEVMRLDGKIFWVNPHMIESMETTPDLTLTMLSGNKIIVRNSPEEVNKKIIEYRRNIGPIIKNDILKTNISKNNNMDFESDNSGNQNNQDELYITDSSQETL